MASFKRPAYCVFNDFTLYDRSVVLRLVPVAEHLEVMGLFAEHHEILTYLIPLCEPAAILLAENMTIWMCAVLYVTTNTRVLEEKLPSWDWLCAISLSYLFAAGSFMLLSPEAAQQLRSSRYQSFKKRIKNWDENTEQGWAGIWAMKVRKPLPDAQTWGSVLRSVPATWAAPSTVPEPSSCWHIWLKY